MLDGNRGVRLEPVQAPVNGDLDPRAVAPDHGDDGRATHAFLALVADQVVVGYGAHAAVLSSWQATIRRTISRV